MNEKIQEIWDKYKSAADGDYLYEGLFPQVVKEILAEAVRMIKNHNIVVTKIAGENEMYDAGIKDAIIVIEYLAGKGGEMNKIIEKLDEEFIKGEKQYFDDWNCLTIFEIENKYPEGFDTHKKNLLHLRDAKLLELVKILITEEISCPDCEGAGVIQHPLWKSITAKHTDKEIRDYFAERGYYNPPPEEILCDTCEGRGKYRRTVEGIIAEIDKLKEAINGEG